MPVKVGFMAEGLAGARAVPDEMRVSVREGDGSTKDGLPWSWVSAERLASAAPWRTFRWYHGQQHFPGSYWSATMSDHVIYESRLELARLLYADFDPAVESVSAQPFLLTAQVGGKERRHVPDFLLSTGSGPVVVDVKPRSRLDKQDVAFTLGWCRAAVESRGWEYEVWSEPPEAELANIRMLAGYRRAWLFDAALLGALTDANLDGARLRDVPAAVTGWPRR